MKTYLISYRTGVRWHSLGTVKAKNLAGALRKAATMAPTVDGIEDCLELSACIHYE